MKGFCAYCGEKWESDSAAGMATLAVTHISNCKTHPITKAADIIARLLKHSPCPCNVKSSAEYQEAHSAAEAFCRQLGMTV